MYNCRYSLYWCLCIAPQPHLIRMAEVLLQALLERLEACSTCSQPVTCMMHCNCCTVLYCTVLCYTALQGGYSTSIVVDQDFVLRLPEALPLAETVPLLCAGITTYSPL